MGSPAPRTTYFERPPPPELSSVGRRQPSPADDGECGWHVAGPETLGMIAAQQHTTVASLIALNRQAYPVLIGHRFAEVRGMVLRVR